MEPISLDEIVKVTKGRLLTPYPPNRPSRLNAEGGQAVRAGKPVIIKGVSTDTRTLKQGDLFIALKGSHFDGHNFISTAIRKKASAVILSTAVGSPFRVLALRTRQGPKGRQGAVGRGVSFIKVSDTLRALGDIARYYRKKLRAKVIAIGGSNGKTTTKDMIAHILSQRYTVTKSPHSYNNAIGVPHTILSAGRNTDCLVAEVGTNKPGEIAYLSEILKPDIAVITNISPTHLEGLKTIKGVFREESSLFRSLGKDGIAVFPDVISGWERENIGGPHDVSNKGLKWLSKYAEYKSFTFGLSAEPTGSGGDEGADVRADPAHKPRTAPKLCAGGKTGFMCGVRQDKEGIRFKMFFPLMRDGKGKIFLDPIRNTKGRECFIPLLGSWNVKNALAAFGVCLLLGLSPEEIISALSRFQPPKMRMERQNINGITFINDAYNANPVSVSLAIQDFSKMSLPGRKILIFGEMRELGQHSKKYHQEIAEQMADSSIDMLLAIGPETRWTIERLAKLKPVGIIPFYYDNVESAITPLRRLLSPGDTVLLKGSRANELEKVILCYTSSSRL